MDLSAAPSVTPHTTQQGYTATRGVDYRFIRDINRLLVLNCVRGNGPLSRAAIARQTHLSRTSVSIIVDSLIAEDWLYEGARSSPTKEAGRPGILVYFRAATRFIVGIDLGRSHLTLVLTDLAVVERGRLALPFSVAGGPHQVIPVIVATMHTFLQQHGVAWEHLLGIGMGLPGPLDEARQTLIDPPHMPGWHDVALGPVFQHALPVPLPVLLEKDTNLGALGEWRYGAGRGVAELVYVKVGTGIGATLVLDGQIYRGHRSLAGEIGHIIVAPHGQVCDCGHHGCLETVASAPAIVHQVRQHQEKAAVADIAEVIASAQSGDAPSRQALAQAGQALGRVLAGVVNLVSPACILLDGSVSHADELVFGPLREALQAGSVPALVRDLQLLRGQLTDRAIGLGAVSLVLDYLFRLPPG